MATVPRDRKDIGLVTVLRPIMATPANGGHPLSAVEAFEQALSNSERQVMARLTTPRDIQAFLDELPYSAEAIYRCPLRVLRERIAHCFDGALFAAAALRRLGYPPHCAQRPG
jgi:hypothetical protein